jgi:hypothetical protein
MKIGFTLLFLLSFCFSQSISQLDAKINKLYSVVETASRSSQKVFIEVFGGLS